jgi:transcription initiation factor TFIIA small subunit
VAEALNNRVKNKATFKGHLHTYRYCDNVWTFILEDAVFRTDTDTVQVDRVKIVACDGKAPQKEEAK